MSFPVELDDIDLGDLGRTTGFAVCRIDEHGNAEVMTVIAFLDLTPGVLTDVNVTHRITPTFRMTIEEFAEGIYARAKDETGFIPEDWQRSGA
jgi:hypothetical protein